MWFVTVTVYLAIQSITPGPNNLTCLYLGANYGFKGARRFIIASGTFLFIKTVLCGALNVLLSRFIPATVEIFKWVGAAYLLFLAWKMMMSGWKDESEGGAQQYESTWAAGALLQLLNAKSWIASISAFAIYVIPYSSTLPAIVAVSAVFFVLVILSSAIWAVFGSALKNFISRWKKPFGIIMGLSLVWCAVSALR